MATRWIRHFPRLVWNIAWAAAACAGSELPLSAGDAPTRLVSASAAFVSQDADRSGERYYVDFDGGSDDHDGRSPGAAFQHCPGDPAAAGRAKSTKLVPGDTIVFKGGVAYRGSITMQESGGEGRPITYDGNSRGQFGEGAAVLDGSELVAGWRRPRSQEECGGNPNWEKLWCAALPFVTDSLVANLYEDARPLAVAQDPNPSDPFYADNFGSYRRYDGNKASPTTLEDPAFLTQPDPQAWDGAYIAIWAVPNAVYFQKVTGFEPSAHRISFEKLPQSHYTDRPGRYAMMNAFAALDRPGEYVVRTQDGRSEIFVWPHDEGSAAPTDISISRRPFGFNLQGHGDVVIEGFTIQKYMSRRGHRGAGITNDEGTPHRIVLRGNIVTACNKDPGSGWKHAGINLGAARESLVEGNQIFENRGCGGIYTFGRGVIVKKNVVRRNGYQGIWVMGGKNCQVIGNEVVDNLGTHSNGISVYAGSSDVEVVGNRVFNSNLAFTAEQSENVTLSRNVFHTPGFYAVADWGRTTNLRLFHNVLRRDDLGPNTVLSMGPGSSVVSRNNIFIGRGTDASLDGNHNLLAGADALDAVFVDSDGRDYRLKPGSPAIDAGSDLGIKVDPLGTAIPQGAAPDAGAYEFSP